MVPKHRSKADSTMPRVAAAISSSVNARLYSVGSSIAPLSQKFRVSHEPGVSVGLPGLLLRIVRWVIVWIWLSRELLLWKLPTLRS